MGMRLRVRMLNTRRPGADGIAVVACRDAIRYAGNQPPKISLNEVPESTMHPTEVPLKTSVVRVVGVMQMGRTDPVEFLCAPFNQCR